MGIYEYGHGKELGFSGKVELFKEEETSTPDNPAVGIVLSDVRVFHESSKKPTELESRKKVLFGRTWNDFRDSLTRVLLERPMKKGERVVITELAEGKTIFVATSYTTSSKTGKEYENLKPLTEDAFSRHIAESLGETEDDDADDEDDTEETLVGMTVKEAITKGFIESKEDLDDMGYMVVKGKIQET